MSVGRIVIRCFLVLLLLFIGFIAYKTYERSQPEHYWNQYELYWSQYETATKNGDTEAANGFLRNARISLENYVKTKGENHAPSARGHLQLSRVLLREAKVEGAPHEYTTNGQALQSLVKAAELAPNDYKLQKMLIGILNEVKVNHEAVRCAARIVKLPEGKNDAEAHYALAVDAVVNNKDSSVVETRLKRLKDLPDYPVIKTLYLELRHLREGADKEALKDLHEKCCHLMMETDGNGGYVIKDDMIKKLSDEEKDIFGQLITHAVAEAPDSAVAQSRAGLALEAIGRVARVDPEDKSWPAEYASNVLAALQYKHPVSEKDSGAISYRKNLDAKAEEYRSAAIEAGVAKPIVYHQAASAAFNDGKNYHAKDILEEGLEKSGKLPEENRNWLLELHLLAARNLLVLKQLDEAKKHLDELKGGNEKAAGWGHLMAGSIDAAEDRKEKALENYRLAQTKLGNTRLVRMALANAYVVAEDWDQAIPHLRQLEAMADRQPDKETEIWEKQNNMSQQQVHWGMLRAILALTSDGKVDELKSFDIEDPRAEIARHLAALKDTPYETAAKRAVVESAWESEVDETAGRVVALQQLRKYREEDPKNIVVLSQWVKYLSDIPTLKVGDREVKGIIAADAEVRRQAARFPDHFQSQIFLAKWQIDRRETRNAIELLDRLMVSHGSDPKNQTTVLVLKAQALLAEDRPLEAQQIADQLKDVPEAAAVRLLILAAALLKEGKLEEAAKIMDEVGDKFKGNGGLQLLRSKILAQINNARGALSASASTLDVDHLSGRADQEVLKNLLHLARTEGAAVAYAELEKIRDQYPDHTILLIAEANLKFQQGEFDECMALLDRLEEKTPDKPEAPYLKGVAYAKKKEYAKALSFVEQAIQRDDEHVPSFVLISEIFYATEDYDKAIAAAREALKHNKDLPNMCAMQVECFKKKKNYAAAEAVVRDFLLDKPKHKRAFTGMLASIAMDAGDYQKAAGIYAEAINDRPEDYGLRQEVIALLAKNKQLPAARKIADDFAADRPGPESYFAIAQAFKLGKQYDDARKWGRKALVVAIENQRHYVHFLLGTIEMDAAMESDDPAAYEAAKMHFEANLEKNPENIYAVNNLAWIMSNRLGKPAEAIKLFEPLMKDADTNDLPANVVETLIEAHRRAGDFDNALRIAQQAVSERPDSALLNFQLGMVFSDLEKGSQAKNYLGRALELGLDEDKERDAKARMSLFN